MPDYSKNIIYVIKCKDENVEEEYIGSTTNFKDRLKSHKSDCNNEKCKHYNFKLYQFIRANGGWENFDMILLEEYSCNSRTEGRCREEEVKVERKAQLNMVKAFRTQEQKKEDKKKWDEENKEKIKIYNEKYKERKIEKQRQRRTKNKEKYNEKARQYYQKKKAEKLLNNIHNEPAESN